MPVLSLASPVSPRDAALSSSRPGLCEPDRPPRGVHPESYDSKAHKETLRTMKELGPQYHREVGVGAHPFPYKRPLSGKLLLPSPGGQYWPNPAQGPYEDHHLTTTFSRSFNSEQIEAAHGVEGDRTAVLKDRSAASAMHMDCQHRPNANASYTFRTTYQQRHCDPIAKATASGARTARSTSSPAGPTKAGSHGSPASGGTEETMHEAPFTGQEHPYGFAGSADNGGAFSARGPREEKQTFAKTVPDDWVTTRTHGHGSGYGINYNALRGASWKQMDHDDTWHTTYMDTLTPGYHQPSQGTRPHDGSVARIPRTGWDGSQSRGVVRAGSAPRSAHGRARGGSRAAGWQR